MPRRYDAKKFDIKHLRATAEKCKNWGKWGPDDQVGTLNYITPQNIIDASFRALHDSMTYCLIRN